MHIGSSALLCHIIILSYPAIPLDMLRNHVEFYSKDICRKQVSVQLCSAVPSLQQTLNLKLLLLLCTPWVFNLICTIQDSRSLKENTR